MRGFRSRSGSPGSFNIQAEGISSAFPQQLRPGVAKVTVFASAAADSAVRFRCKCQASSVVYSSLPGSLSFRHSSQRLLRPPASGYRTRETGGLTNVGTNGYSWSSSAYAAGSATSGGLNFNSSNVNPLNSFSGRALAFPVRCVQHLQAAFPKNKGACIKQAPSFIGRGLNTDSDRL